MIFNCIKVKVAVTGFILILLIVLYGCNLFEFDTEIDITKKYNNEEVSLTQYFDTLNDDFSELSAILRYTNLDKLFNAYGTYTFFAPDNNAFHNYYALKGKSSWQDFTVDELDNLLKYHVLTSVVSYEDFPAGIIKSPALNGDNLLISYSDVDNSVFINKKSKIIYFNDKVSNGLIHKIDRVIDLLDYTVFDWVKQNENDYSIITRAFEETKVNEVLNQLIDPDKSGYESQIMYTLFVEPDSVYAKNNIHSFDDLVARYPGPDGVNYSDSIHPLRIFLLNHCIGKRISISEMPEEQTHFATIEGEIMQLGYGVGSEHVFINISQELPGGINIDEYNSNNIAKNGIVHVLEDEYQIVRSFERVTVTVYFCDYPGIPFDSLTAVGFGTDKGCDDDDPETPCQWWPSGSTESLDQNNIEGISWEPYPEQIRVDNHKLPGHELILRIENHPTALWDITFDIPAIIPGKYEVIIKVKFFNNRATIRCYLDEEAIGLPIDMNFGDFNEREVPLDIYDLTEAKDRKFRVKAIAPGFGFLHYVKFVPVD